MNYELAKQLKDAGFPQVIDFRSGEFHDGDEEISNPSLSELIEACGDNFELSNMIRGEANRKNGNWLVMKDSGYEQIGHTPEEAVALLWLELNKK